MCVACELARLAREVSSNSSVRSRYGCTERRRQPSSDLEPGGLGGEGCWCALEYEGTPDQATSRRLGEAPPGLDDKHAG